MKDPQIMALFMAIFLTALALAITASAVFIHFLYTWLF